MEDVNEVMTVQVTEMDSEVLSKLYEELDKHNPTSDEYKQILSRIQDVRQMELNNLKLDKEYWEINQKMEIENKKLEKEKDDAKKNRWIKIGEIGVTSGLTAGMFWLTLKYNLAQGAMSLKDCLDIVKRTFKKH